MLTDAKKKELLVFYTIVQTNKCSLRELSQVLSIPKRTIKEIIRKLNGTIFQQLSIPRFIYSTAKGELKLDSQHKDEKMAIFHYICFSYANQIVLIFYCYFLIRHTAVFQKKYYWKSCTYLLLI